MTWRTRINTLCTSLAATVALGCSTTLDNAPHNQPISAQTVARTAQPRDIVDTNAIGLSLSGGGLRASAFAYGVLRELARQGDGEPDVFDDLTFISSVSGGSLAGAYFALHGRSALSTFRTRVLERDYERNLRLSWFAPENLLRLLAGGVNDRSNLAQILDAEVFDGATFADLLRANKPDIWINATDLFNRTPFPFIPPVFNGLCSDLLSLRVSEAVSASMAVPLAFAPVVLRTYPQQCLTPPPHWLGAAEDESASVAAGTLAATARAVARYRDGTRMRYVKLADGGLTDNQGLSSILVARAAAGTPMGPLNEADAVRLRRMLFLIVDAGRPPGGDWALAPEGPSGLDVGVAAADAAIDSATRLSAAAFRTMYDQWRDGIVRHRCSLTEEQARRWLRDGEPWRCDDVQFYLDVIGFERLPAHLAERMRQMPTRLALSPADLETAIAAGQAAARGSAALARYRAQRVPASDAHSRRP